MEFSFDTGECISSFATKHPLLPLGFPAAFQAIVAAYGTVAQEQSHEAADIGDKAAPLICVVVDLLCIPVAREEDHNAEHPARTGEGDYLLMSSK